MLSGVGMTEIVVRRALRNDFVLQIAVRGRARNGAEDSPRTANLNLVCHGAQTLAIRAAKLEDSASLQDEAAGTSVRLARSAMGLNKLQSGSCQMS